MKWGPPGLSCGPNPILVTRALNSGRQSRRRWSRGDRDPGRHLRLGPQPGAEGARSYPAGPCRRESDSYSRPNSLLWVTDVSLSCGPMGKNPGLASLGRAPEALCPRPQHVLHPHLR